MRPISSIALACAGLMLSACGGGDGGSSLSPQASAALNTANAGSNAVTPAATVAMPACGANGTSALAGVQTWMYQLQGMTTSAQIDTLNAQPYDMLVIEANNTIKGLENFNTVDMVARLHTKPDGSARKVLAYIDIGEAEDFRTYWTSSWQAPTSTSPGTPDFIIKADPDGWAGDYPVAFWDPRWQALWLGPDGAVAQLAREGFDGVYLDWVQAYAEPSVADAARAAGIDPVQAMVDFITKIRAAGRAINPQFAVIQQNASTLIDDGGGSTLLATIDGISQEDTWFGGTAGAAWDSASGGDNAASADSTQWAINQLQKYCAGNVPVFTIDYALQTANAQTVYAASRGQGFHPLVSRIALSKPTTTPPWNY
nr:endo alpha-1,4 polygalactosaminidase [uncultured Ralstonia sp.]